MQTILGKNTSFVPFFTELILLLTVLVVISLVVSISGIILFYQIGDIRCFTSSALMLIPPKSEYMGTTNGKLEFGPFAAYWDMHYYLPEAEGSIIRITINGPLEDFGMAADPVTDVIALTICGGEVSCADMEASTCMNEHLHGGCGLIAGKRDKLDDMTPDIPIPGGSTEIGKLMRELKENPELFYLNIETTAHPNGAQRASLGSVCKI